MDIDPLHDAIVEDTCHCTVCGASFVLGSNDPYVILAPPGPMLKAIERGCQQVKLCPECAERVVTEWNEAIENDHPASIETATDDQIIDIAKRRGLLDLEDD